MFATDIRADALDPGETTEFYLLTVGIGDTVDSRYGHTILRVYQPGQEAQNYNWGTFSFDAPYFPARFFLGKLRYWVDASSDASVEWRYHEEKRSVIRDRLQLTPKQKTDLLRLVEFNMQEDNKYYVYDFFLNNCATILRDHINTVLHNQVLERFSTTKTPMRYRDYVRNYLNTPNGSDAFLEIAMNGTIDFPLSPWEEMFFPLKLREYLQQMPAIDDAGKAIDGKFLLTDAQQWIQIPERSLVYTDFYWFACTFLTLFLLMLLRQMHRGRIPLRSLGALLLLWSLFSGTIGSIMTIAWLLSEHIVLQHNANLWFFWPLDLWLLCPAWSWCRRRALSPRVAKMAVYLLGAHCVFFLVAGGLRWGHWITQDIDKILLFLMIPMNGIYAIALHYARKQPFLAARR